MRYWGCWTTGSTQKLLRLAILKLEKSTGARYKNTMQRGGEGKGEAVEVVVYQDAGFVRGGM